MPGVLKIYLGFDYLKVEEYMLHRAILFRIKNTKHKDFLVIRIVIIKRNISIIINNIAIISCSSKIRTLGKIVILLYIIYRFM